MSALCCKCKKRPAVVFVQKFDPTGKNAAEAEGYCLVCAKKLGIGPVNDMLEKMGIDDEQLENMSDELTGLMESGEFFPGMPQGGNPDDPDAPDGDGNDFAPLLKYGLIKERFSAMLTDSIRACVLEDFGYEVDVVEFVGFESTPKNLMIRAVLKKQPRRANRESLLKLKEKYGFEQTLLRLTSGEE